MRDLAPFTKCREDGKPRLMGIVNATPDSFHTDSRVESVETAIERGIAMWEQGADWVDVGGESTRPGASPVNVEQEIDRVIPIIEGLRNENPNGLISIDTRHHEVAKAALDAGANMINDVSGLRDQKMFDLVVDTKSPVCIMHMLGEPRNMQEKPQYIDVVSEVSKHLLDTAERLINAGHPANLIILDPGIGFGKTMEHNLSLLGKSENLRGESDFSILWGVRRKSIFKDILNREKSEQRLAGTLGVAAQAFCQGIDILRVHDVTEHNDLLIMMSKLRCAANE